MSNISQQHDTELGWIARNPDNETFIFRRFDRSAARNILHLQARLIALEHEIDQLDEEARENDVVVLQAQITAIRRPDSRPVLAFRDFLEGKVLPSKLADPMPLISGRAKAFLDDDNDLMALARPIEEDHLSRFLQDHWLIRKRRDADPFDRTTIHKNLHVVRTAAALDIALAAVLLIGAIVILYLVARPKAKLGFIAMFTVLFAFSVALCTNARRAEVFAATAANAAVLVVFCLIQLEGAIWKTVKCPG
ncbi:hypothetical protein EK21DRAFT_98475 [Setomelanomma holmii]|uniref:DUF6594 domain-containing protein n=1 Tax=Setomelanomma holmii TaxID=210430 RepID=A0A9P4HH59_9PLEO|nr:hypothetical protein EK21DRAFT_98475 [Setomelanomma holmii]